MKARPKNVCVNTVTASSSLRITARHLSVKTVQKTRPIFLGLLLDFFGKVLAMFLTSNKVQLFSLFFDDRDALRVTVLLFCHSTLGRMSP